jgi:hypothetical protein
VKLVKGSGPHAAAICEALGLNPKKTTSVVLSMDCEQAITVTVRQYVDDKDAERLGTVLRRFNLVPEEE